jgi:hypothetical protein
VAVAEMVGTAAAAELAAEPPAAGVLSRVDTLFE